MYKACSLDCATFQVSTFVLIKKKHIYRFQRALGSEICFLYPMPCSWLSHPTINNQTTEHYGLPYRVSFFCMSPILLIEEATTGIFSYNLSSLTVVKKIMLKILNVWKNTIYTPKSRQVNLQMYKNTPVLPFVKKCQYLSYT